MVFCVFLESVFVCLAPINHRAKLTAEVAYTSPMIKSSYSEPPPYVTLTCQANIPPALNQPRAGTRQLETALMPQSPLELFKLTNPKLFTLPCLAFPLETQIKALA